MRKVKGITGNVQYDSWKYGERLGANLELKKIFFMKKKRFARNFKKEATWPWAPLAKCGQIKLGQTRDNLFNFHWKGTKYIREEMTCSSHNSLDISRKARTRKRREKSLRPFGHREFPRKKLQKFFKNHFLPIGGSLTR